MRLPKPLLTALLLSFILSPALAADADLPTVEQLLAKMTEAASKVRTFEADMTVVALERGATATSTMHMAIDTGLKDG